jgi:hypothetical protein
MQPTQLIEEVTERVGFARKNEDGRKADRRLATATSGCLTDEPWFENFHVVGQQAIGVSE